MIRTVGAVIGALTACLLLADVPAAAADWPQWRGPDRDGHARHLADPGDWPSDLAPLWRQSVGAGHSGPVVAGERLYLHVRTEDGEAVEARATPDGELVWRREYATAYEVHPEADWHGRGPFSTPLVADGVLYTFGIAEVLSAFRADDGELLWRRDFGDEFDAPWAYYGTSLSPILVGDLLVVHAGGPGDGALVGLDAGTGTERWRWGGDGPPYGSAIVTVFDGVEQLVSFTQKHLVGVAPATGDVLWSLPYEVPWDNTVQTPVVTAGGLLVMAAWDTPARGYRIRNVDGTWRAEVTWENEDLPNPYSSPVVFGDDVWTFTHRDGGRLHRIDGMTGEITWSGEPRRGDHATLVGAGEHLLVFAESGELEVYDTTAEPPTVAARHTVSDSAVWAHPAVLGDGFVVKGQGELTRWRTGPPRD